MGQQKHGTFAAKTGREVLTVEVSIATVPRVSAKGPERASELAPGTNALLGETLMLCHDRPTGLSAAIAVDDTTLGPGLGGVRWMPYTSFGAAVEEACRLSQGMTLKNALADIPYGGAKSVIMRREGDGGDPAWREAQLRAFAGFVSRLGGSYIPGVDMGTSVADLAVIATVAPWVSCNHEDPSPATASGVFHAIAAAVRHELGRDLSGVRVTVQGAGHVGSALARLLADRGALVGVADVDIRRAHAVARSVGGVVVAPDDALARPCDVFAPCASARVLRRRLDRRAPLPADCGCSQRCPGRTVLCANVWPNGASSTFPISCPMPGASCRSTPNGPVGMRTGSTSRSPPSGGVPSTSSTRRRPPAPRPSMWPSGGPRPGSGVPSPFLIERGGRGACREHQ